MQNNLRIAVIGAGLSGLTCARTLADAGHAVTVFDKGRGLGGRMASRRADGWRFDHGAIALRPTSDAFAAFVTHSQSEGFAAHWEDANGWTGVPGMSGIVKPLATGLTVHNQAEVTALERGPDGWTLHGPEKAAGMLFDRLILAIPQPQACRLLSAWPHLQAQVNFAGMDPCWTVMVGFDTPLPHTLAYASYAEGPISVIARENPKPGRDLPGDGWVIQASADWSRRHLECERSEAMAPLLEAFFTTIDRTPVAPDISMAHRWRYALTSKPLGQSYLNDATIGLSICGDWCLGNTAQDAFDSGHRLAMALTSQA